MENRDAVLAAHGPTDPQPLLRATPEPKLNSSIKNEGK